MKLYNIKGRLVNKSVSKYIINWDKKSRSKAQFNTKQFLKQFWLSQIVFEEFPVYGSRLKVDFFNASKNLIIEVQGMQHDEYNPFFHADSKMNFLKSIKRDMAKYEWADKNNLKLIEIYTYEVPKLSRKFFEEKFQLIL